MNDTKGTYVFKAKMLDGRLSNEITSIPSSLKDSQRREGVRGGVHNFKGAKGPRGASYMDQLMTV